MASDPRTERLITDRNVAVDRAKHVEVLLQQLLNKVRNVTQPFKDRNGVSIAAVSDLLDRQIYIEKCLANLNSAPAINADNTSHGCEMPQVQSGVQSGEESLEALLPCP